VDAKVDLALGILGERGHQIEDAMLFTRERTAASIIGGWVRDSQDLSASGILCVKQWLL
jgi:hypothetical protein